MKIKHQLSIAALLLAGVFVTGCSQQNAGGASQAQVEGASQSQVEGGSQVAGGSQQQVEKDPVVVAPPSGPTKTTPLPPPRVAKNPWTHTHPAIPGCTDSVTHTHKYTNPRHTHNYACKGQKRKQTVDVFALQRKLKAKGYYKGPIDGIVGPGTRSALQRFMKR